jgi:hypothetical protein
MASDDSKQFWLIRRYLRQYEVETPLTLRILRYLESAKGRKKEFISEERLPMLDDLSYQLKAELKCVVHFGGLLHHPLFKWAHHTSEPVMIGLVENVLSQKHLAQDDVAFMVSAVPGHMSVIVEGVMNYAKQGDKELHLHRDDWVCEHSLWVPWSCKGNLVAEMDCQLILIDHKEFAEVIREEDALYPIITCYAEVYVKWLNGLAEHSQTMLSDVCLYQNDAPRVEAFIEDAKHERDQHEKEAKKEQERELKRALTRAKLALNDH